MTLSPRTIVNNHNVVGEYKLREKVPVKSRWFNQSFNHHLPVIFS